MTTDSGAEARRANSADDVALDTEKQKEAAFVDIDDTLADSSEEETARVVDKIAERQLCRKFDVRLMPVLAIMCKWTRKNKCVGNFYHNCRALDYASRWWLALAGLG